MAEWKRPSPETAPTAAKATGLYMIGTLSKHKAEAEGFADALMLDWRGLVAEATGANIFFVIDGELHTPTPDCFLDGITRRSVMALAQAPADEGGRAADPAGGDEAGDRGVPGRHGGGGDPGARDRRELSFTPGQISETLLSDYEALVRKGPDEVARIVG